MAEQSLDELRAEIASVDAETAEAEQTIRDARAEEQRAAERNKLESQLVAAKERRDQALAKLSSAPPAKTPREARAAAAVAAAVPADPDTAPTKTKTDTGSN